MVMFVGAVILGGDGDDGNKAGGDLNMRAVRLDTAGDAAAAAGVAVAGAVIYLMKRLTGFRDMPECPLNHRSGSRLEWSAGPATDSRLRRTVDVAPLRAIISASWKARITG